MTDEAMLARIAHLEAMVARLAQACAGQRYGAVEGTVYMDWTTRNEFEEIAQSVVAPLRAAQ